MGRKIFQGIVIVVAMFFLSSGTEAEAGAEKAKPGEVPQDVQLSSDSSIRNGTLVYLPLIEQGLEGTQKIETGSTPEPEPEQNEEEAENDLEANSAPVLKESVEIIEETQMNGVSAKLQYYRSNWDGFRIAKLVFYLGLLMLFLISCCYECCCHESPTENLILVTTHGTSEGEDSTQV